MQRDLSITIGVIGFVVVVAILIFANNTGNGLSLSESNNIPTGFILGATATDQPTGGPTPTLTTTPPLIKSPTPTVSTSVTPSPTTKVTTTPTPAQIAKCTANSTYQKAKLLANQFMSQHKLKAGFEVLRLISPPESDDDIAKYSYWMGEDTPTQTIQLYQTTSTSYTTISFSLGTALIDRGEHTEIRGTRRCELTLHEKRSTIDTEGTAHDENLPLFLDFSLSDDGELKLTAFKDARSGTKYSGFD